LTLVNVHAPAALYESLIEAKSLQQSNKKERGAPMSMLKVIEVLSESDKSWEDAAQQAVTKAGKTVHNVKSIYIKNFEATVDNGKLKKFRINGKISFMLD
jgi:hypothetical protein